MYNFQGMYFVTAFLKVCILLPLTKKGLSGFLKTNFFRAYFPTRCTSRASPPPHLLHPGFAMVRIPLLHLSLLKREDIPIYKVRDLVQRNRKSWCIGITATLVDFGWEGHFWTGVPVNIINTNQSLKIVKIVKSQSVGCSLSIDWLLKASHPCLFAINLLNCKFKKMFLLCLLQISQSELLRWSVP